jgi:hypothetical protein
MLPLCLWGQGSEMGIDDMINLDTFGIRFRHRWSLKIFRCDQDSFGLLPLLIFERLHETFEWPPAV